MKNFAASPSMTAIPGHDPAFSGLFDVIADWVEAMHGHMPLADALERLICGLGAEAGMVVRTHLNDMRPVRVHMCDPRGARCGNALNTSFADGCFGSAILRPRPATVWVSSAHMLSAGGSGHAPLDEWQAARGLYEFMVLVLSGGPATRDHIELHFRKTPTPTLQAALGVVLPTMARAWASRRVGLITNLTSVQRAIDRGSANGDGGLPVLSIANPHRLSRAEFRVCLLFSRGLSAAGVADELSLSEATIRSHLRSIYAKTGTSSLAELVFLLLGPVRGPSDRLNRCA